MFIQSLSLSTIHSAIGEGNSEEQWVSRALQNFITKKNDMFDKIYADDVNGYDEVSRSAVGLQILTITTASVLDCQCSGTIADLRKEIQLRDRAIRELYGNSKMKSYFSVIFYEISR